MNRDVSLFGCLLLASCLTFPVGSSSEIGCQTPGGSLLERLERVRVYGIDEGEPEWQRFGRFVFSYPLPDGRLVIIDHPDLMIRLISPDGELLRTVGGKGSGPGEFRGPGQVSFVENRREVWIFDGPLQRITRYDLDFVLLGTAPIPDGPSISRFHLHDDLFLATRYEYHSKNTETVFGTWTLEGGMEDLGRFLNVGRSIDAGGGVQVPIPFYPPRVVLPSPSGCILFLDTPEDRVVWYRSDGTSLTESVLGSERVSLSDESIERWKEGFRRQHHRDPRVTRSDFPEYLPAFGQGIVDALGWLWLSRTRTEMSDDGGVRWVYDVFDEEGSRVGVQRLPFRPQELTIGADLLYRTNNGAWEKILHGPRIEEYRLRFTSEAAARRAKGQSPR